MKKLFLAFKKKINTISWNSYKSFLQLNLAKLATLFLLLLLFLFLFWFFISPDFCPSLLSSALSFFFTWPGLALLLVGLDVGWFFLLVEVLYVYHIICFLYWVTKNKNSTVRKKVLVYTMLFLTLFLALFLFFGQIGRNNSDVKFFVNVEETDVAPTNKDFQVGKHFIAIHDENSNLDLYYIDNQESPILLATELGFIFNPEDDHQCEYQKLLKAKIKIYSGRNKIGEGRGHIKQIIALASGDYTFRLFWNPFRPLEKYVTLHKVDEEGFARLKELYETK